MEQIMRRCKEVKGTVNTLMTPREAAEFLRWSVSTLYTYASRRRLPSVKVGRSLRFRRSDLEKLVKAGERPALRSGGCNEG